MKDNSQSIFSRTSSIAERIKDQQDKEKEKKRVAKAGRKQHAHERKLRILKSFYVNDDNKLRMDASDCSKIMQQFKEKVVDFNKKEKRCKNKMKLLVEQLTANPNDSASSTQSQSLKLSVEKPQQDLITSISEKFHITKEQAEKAWALKGEIEQMDAVIQNAKINGMPVGQNEKEYLVTEI